MSKRFFPQQTGDRKRAKLDVSISDHNFPLSQNKEPEQDNWGDDNDDEILLLASQACEEACNANDISLLPNYSMCMQPGSTSTQLYSTPGPSTSQFTFKKPTANIPSAISTELRQKCSRISSPLPGITANATPKAIEPMNVSEDYIFNDKVYKGQDSNHIYRQLLQLQEENAKLKSENGKLLEKCVTKEGEASILRTQLKTCQVSVDNARLEKIKAQERVQIEWTEKLAAANNQMQDLRTQLDFKNLEIISIKERCKKLESSKVKLTQVTVGNNDISSSYRQSSSFLQNESSTQRRVKTLCNAVQTEDDNHFLNVNVVHRTESPPLLSIIPYILEPSCSPYSILEYNENLSHSDTQHKYPTYNLLQRLPTSNRRGNAKGNQLEIIYEDVVKIAAGLAGSEQYFNVLNAVQASLTDTQSRLNTISRRMSLAFQKEMDERYIESTSTFVDITQEDLLKGRAVYKDEQEICSRRVTALLSYVLQSDAASEALGAYRHTDDFIQLIENICCLIDSTCTGTLHSGLLLAISFLLPVLQMSVQKTLSIIRSIISSRPTAAVACKILELLSRYDYWQSCRKEICPGTNAGNLKTDYDQGVLLYKKDNCHLQVLLKQLESALQCCSRQALRARAARTAAALVQLFCTVNQPAPAQDVTKCECSAVLIQVMVYGVRECAVMLQHSEPGSTEYTSLMACCRSGVRALYRGGREAELRAPADGHLAHFCHIMKSYSHPEIYASMVCELGAAPALEEPPPAYHRPPWLTSFHTFSITD